MVTLISGEVGELERRSQVSVQVCVQCCGWSGRLCSSTDCPAMYRRRNMENKRKQIEILQSLIDKL